MGIFSRKPSAPTPRPVPPASTPVPLSTLNLAPVEWWANHFLVRSGLEYQEVQALQQQYPTPPPAPNIDFTFSAGDPPNPWTLAICCAEQAVCDALIVYITISGKFMPREVALDHYAKSGLEGLVGVISTHERQDYLQFVHEVANAKIEASFDNFFARLLGDYLSNFWPQREPFTAQLS